MAAPGWTEEQIRVAAEAMLAEGGPLTLGRLRKRGACGSDAKMRKVVDEVHARHGITGRERREPQNSDFEIAQECRRQRLTGLTPSVDSLRAAGIRGATQRLTRAVATKQYCVEYLPGDNPTANPPDPPDEERLEIEARIAAVREEKDAAARAGQVERVEGGRIEPDRLRDEPRGRIDRRVLRDDPSLSGELR